jgi:GT2 family glycosyltransferase
MNTIRVGVVIVNWNGWQDTTDCLASLNRMSDQDFAVVVVDNGSQDQSLLEIRSRFPKAQIIEMGFNSGFSVANNAGMKLMIGLGVQFVWLLNNDTIVHPEALAQLVLTASQPRVGVVGAVLYEAHQPEQIQIWGGGSLNVKLGTTTAFKAKTNRPLEHIIGASMFFPVAVLQRVGLLNEAFFFYLEDTEISYRVRKAGYGLLVSEQCSIWHKGGASVNAGRQEKSLQSEQYFARANGVFLGLHSGWDAFVFVPLRLLGVTLLRLKRGQLSRLPMIMQNFWQGFVFGWSKRSRQL